MKTLAVIPARAGSKRLPGKNIRPFLGKPLVHWSIEFARAFERFDQVLVSTDSDAIAEHCIAAGIEVPTRRPADLATDMASSADVVLDVLRQVDHFDLVALLQPTTPIRARKHWERAFALLESGAGDAVVGVAPVHDHPFHMLRLQDDDRLQPWHDAGALTLRSQDLPPVVVVNGSLYLIRTQVLRETQTFFPARTLGVVCDGPCAAIDIDTEADWVAAEALVAHFGAEA